MIALALKCFGREVVADLNSRPSSSAAAGDRHDDAPEIADRQSWVSLTV